MKTKILFLLLVISLLFVSCEEKHEHQWTTKIEKEAGCETKGLLVRTCPCGATEKEEIPAPGHKEQVTRVKTPATCTTEGVSETVCSECGKVFSTAPIPKTAHTPGEEVVITEPTCTVKGKAEIKCTVCDALIEEKEIPATGHKLLETGKVVKKGATCTETGLEAGVCAICGETLEEVETPALGHDWGETVVITGATCTTEGKAQQTCKRCQATRDGVIEKKPHNFTGESTVTKEPTCTEKGEVVTKCANANCTATTISHTDALGHEFTIDQGYKKDANGNAIEPTQFRPGIKIYKCSRCDATEEREVESESKHIHSSVANGYYDYNNTYKRNEPGTCVKKAKIGVYCRTCFVDNEGNFYSSESEAPAGVELTRYFVGYHEGDLDPNNHVNTETITSTEPSYFYGSKSEVKCKDCNTVISTTINDEGKVSAIGHWEGSQEVSIVLDPNSGAKGTLNIDLGFDFYPSGISVVEKSKMTMTPEDNKDAQQERDMLWFDSNLETLRTTVDGKKIGKWDTNVINNKLNCDPFFKGEKLYILILGEDVGASTLSFDMTGQGATSGTLKWQELSTNKNSVLAMINVKSLNASSFSKSDDGIDTVTLPAGTTEITLEAVALVDTISGCTWYVNDKGRNDASATQTINVSTESTRVDVDVYVNGAKETHSAIFKVATN